MYRNRISRLTAGLELQSQPSLPAGTPPISPVAIVQTSVLVPCAIRVACWQTQLYRLAYEQAAAQLAPPRHMTHFFSVWN